MRRIVSVWTVLLSLTDNLVTHYRKLFNREASSGHVTSAMWIKQMPLQGAHGLWAGRPSVNKQQEPGRQVERQVESPLSPEQLNFLLAENSS